MLTDAEAFPAAHMREQARRDRNGWLPLAGSFLVIRLALEDTALKINVTPSNARHNGGVADIAMTAAGVDADQDEAGDMAGRVPSGLAGNAAIATQPPCCPDQLRCLSHRSRASGASGNSGEKRVQRPPTLVLK